VGEIRLHRDGTTFFVRLIADIAEREDCQSEGVSIPFRLEIPLNVVNLPEGPYDVNVNGVTASFDPLATPASPSTGPFQLAYIGNDGNVWFHPGPGSEPRQLTTDASSSDGGAGITYYFPQISDDGQWVAYRRDVATTLESGLEYTFGLWIYNLTTGESQQILEEAPAGFAWKPGTHLLAYGLGVPEGYFSFGSDTPIDSSLARGVMAFNADTGETIELVRPERGYALYSLQWSPDGRFLSFDELVYIEGRGPFAYYDFEAGSYVAWEEPIGNYAWSPDSTRIFYDRMIYVANGTEEVFVRSMPEGDEERLTDYASETEYAFSPALSPGGDRIAHLASLSDNMNQTSTLFVQDLAGGEPISLGTFDMALNLAWSPDGEWLVFSAGPWEGQQLIAVHVSDGAVAELGPGTMPDVAGNAHY
jgi:Tol biopolymer transport system component